ncbi:MAG: glycosyltransferase family 2 protein [Oscillospiraceae bacterium]|nr:glycosyltransferase family 2 protein [Oscillospiraceae bacterium]
MGNTVYFVVPCYNEEEVLPETSKRLLVKMKDLVDQGKVSPDSKICFVDDGSRDRTWAMIEELHEQLPVFTGVKLSRNRGHQNALLGGMMTVKDDCDALISLDADLQDDPDAIDRMIDQWIDGSDIVYGVRSARKTDTFFKRFTAESFYRIMELMGAQIVFNHADYRLLSRRALDALAEYREVNLFLRGMIPTIGFKTSTVTYERNERFAGESKYPLKKMLALAWNGITSFSTRPLEMIVTFGVILMAVAAVLLLVCAGRAIWGTAPQAVEVFSYSLWLIGGIQLLALGVVGEYIGKIYAEAKGRPRYIIESYLG